MKGLYEEVNLAANKGKNFKKVENSSCLTFGIFINVDFCGLNCLNHFLLRYNKAKIFPTFPGLAFIVH